MAAAGLRYASPLHPHDVMRGKMKTTKIVTIVIAFLVLLVASHVFPHIAIAGRPVEGYVPDEETAIAIAMAVWTPIYGKDRIEDKKPYKATLKGGVWHVREELCRKDGEVECRRLKSTKRMGESSAYGMGNRAHNQALDLRENQAGQRPRR